MATPRRTGDSFKVVLLGEGRVGKTSLMLRYCENKFNEEHISTVQASFLTKRLSDPPISVAIWDTAGQERFHALGPLYYRDADGALLIYDITDADSFARARKWVEELHTMLGTDITLILVGNKSDLTTRRTVSQNEAATYASNVGASHMEISVKLNQGVDELFRKLALQMIETRKRRIATPNGRSSTIEQHSSFHTTGASRAQGLQVLDESDNSGRPSGGSNKSCSC